MPRIIDKGLPRGTYGAALTPQSVESLIAQDRLAHAQWERTRPAEVARIEQAMKRMAH